MSDTRFALIVLAAAAALTFSASPDLHAQQAFAAGILDFIFSWNELSIALLT